MADEAKAKGNAAFAAGNFDEAIRHFTDAIALSPTNHVLHSNRSAAYTSVKRFSDALADAEKTVELNPTWPKGYSRLGAAHLGLGNADAAVAAYEKGIAIDPSNDILRPGLAVARAKLRSSANGGAGASPLGKIFQGPEVCAKLTADPSTRNYLQEPDFVRMMQDIQKNPSSINMYLNDPRMMQVLKMSGRPGDEEMGRDFPAEPEEEAAEPAKKAASEPEPEPEPTEDVDDEERVKKKRKLQAQRDEEAGNAAYKKKDFEEESAAKPSQSASLDEAASALIVGESALLTIDSEKLMDAMVQQIRHLFLVASEMRRREADLAQRQAALSVTEKALEDANSRLGEASSRIVELSSQVDGLTAALAEEKAARTSAEEKLREKAALHAQLKSFIDQL